VVVLLGDKRKPDPLKPMGIFDDDDIYTIDKLKEALNELEDYRFSYLDNHDTLIFDLIKIKPKINFVFNLCDEGYFNDPLKEAHIPALLEILRNTLHWFRSSLFNILLRQITNTGSCKGNGNSPYLQVY